LIKHHNNRSYTILGTFVRDRERERESERERERELILPSHTITKCLNDSHASDTHQFSVYNPDGNSNL